MLAVRLSQCECTSFSYPWECNVPLRVGKLKVCDAYKPHCSAFTSPNWVYVLHQGLMGFGTSLDTVT